MTTPAWITQFDGDPSLRLPSIWKYLTNEPPAGYQFFNAQSPWNTPVPASPVIDANSTAIIAWLNGAGGGSGPVDRYVGGGQNASGDFDYPLYFASAGDPIVRIKGQSGQHDTSNANYNRKGIASIAHNMLMPLPASALAAGGSDQILAVMTKAAIFEMWGTYGWAPGAGMVGCRWPTYTLLSGNGMPAGPFGCSSSGYSVVGGNIRIADLNAGRIPHAIRLNTRYVRWNAFQNPANGSALGDPGVTPGDANDLNRPVTGSRVWWSLSDAATNALGIPAWKKTILRALHEFGGIITDTSASGSWHWKVEDGTVDQFYGNQDRWKTYALAQAWAAVGGSDPNYIMPCATGVDWSNLRMLSPANFSF